MKEIKTLSEFIDWASQFNDGQYLFRGVPDDNFEIEASAYRRLPKADRNNPSKLLRINQRLIEDARSQGHDQKNGQELSDLELLAELQHFRAATCLIDVSRSALHALWFACLKRPTEEGEANGKVFAVRRDDVVHLKVVTPQLIKEDLDYFFKSDENDRYPLYQWTPKLQNNRIIAQHSVFLFGGAQIEVATECVIMQSNKPEILKSLAEASDITEATMFPDFDGFARLYAHDKPYIEPDARVYLRRGIDAAQRGDWDVAITYYNEAISLDNDNSVVTQAYFSRGVAYRQKGDSDRAIEDYTKTIEREPLHTEAYLNRGTAYHSKGDYQQAINNYTEAIKLNPNYADAYSNRGFVYNNKGMYDEAILDFNTAIELNSKNASLYNARGFAYNRKGEYEWALPDFHTAMQLNPKFARAYFNRGITWLHLENWEYARLDLTTAKNMGVDIINAFQRYYPSITDFTQATRIQLPPDITAMLTPPQA